MSESGHKKLILFQDSVSASVTVADTTSTAVTPDTLGREVEETAPTPVSDSTLVQTVPVVRNENAGYQVEEEPVPQMEEEDLSGRMPAIRFTESIYTSEKDSAIQLETGDIDRFSFFSRTDSTRFDRIPEPFLSVSGSQKQESSHDLAPIPHQYQRSALNWTLVIGFISIFLLLALKTYYRRLVAQVVTTLVNFQLAEKLYREKNVIVRRAFILMNLNFILIISLFIMLLTIYWDFKLTGNYFTDYLSILGIVVAVLVARLILFYSSGLLFEKLPPVSEHIHLIYLVNKNLGLILLPLSFIAIYASGRIAEIALITGVSILLIATVYKLIRGFLIILRGGVFLFYAIMYLCTLELLPLALGSKLIISLR